jgi:hypothetical protein
MFGVVVEALNWPTCAIGAVVKPLGEKMLWMDERLVVDSVVGAGHARSGAAASAAQMPHVCRVNRRRNGRNFAC